MLAFLGFSSQAAVQGLGPIECLQKHLADPGHNNSEWAGRRYGRVAPRPATTSRWLCHHAFILRLCTPPLSDAMLSPDAPTPPTPPPAVFTSAVGNEATVAVIVLSIAPFLNEVKNKLEGEALGALPLPLPLNGVCVCVRYGFATASA